MSLSLIKIKSKDLKQKTNEELIEMKKKLKMALIGYMKKLGNKFYNTNEIKKNIARINTILKERKQIIL